MAKFLLKVNEANIELDSETEQSRDKTKFDIFKELVPIPRIIMMVVFFLCIFLIGPYLIQKLHSSGVKNISATTGGVQIIFENDKYFFALLTIHANQYLPETNSDLDVKLRSGKVYKIVSTGGVNTGTAFHPNRIIKDDDFTKDINDWDNKMFMTWLNYKFDYKISLRKPDGELVHKEYERLNDSEDDLQQKFADGMLILPRDKCDYGCLVAVALPKASLLKEVRINPWKFRKNMFPIRNNIDYLKVKKISKFKMDKVEWDIERKELLIGCDDVNIYFLINDCVIPDVLRDVPKSNPQYSKAVVRYLHDKYNNMEDLTKNQSFDQIEKNMKNSFILARELDDISNKENNEIGSRDLFYSDNSGHLTVVISEE